MAESQTRLLRDILQTLKYSDFFDYPLTREEVRRWLVRVRVRARVGHALEELMARREVARKDGYYFLIGRQENVKLRRQKEKWSKEKLLLAKKVACRLKALPWIKLIGLTGALAMNNAGLDDDIDLLIITQKNRLWLTRAMILVLSPVLGIKRRKPGERQVQDKICFNLFLDEADLEIKDKSFFTAHEICQVKPLYNQDQTYEKFIWENKWVEQYLPNAVSFNNLTIKQCNNCSGIAKLLNCLIAVLNKMAFKIQYWYMKPKITNEKVFLHQAFFHPRELSSVFLT